MKEGIFNMDNNITSANTVTVDLDTQDNFTVLKGYFTQVHQIGDGKMILFKFEGISSYGKLIIEGLTFVGLYDEMLGALKDEIEVTLTGELRLYKNKRTNEFKIQIEATDILYHD